jgi:hypothetical protein
MLFTVYCLTGIKNHLIFSVKPVMRVTVFSQNSILLSAIGRCDQHLPMANPQGFQGNPGGYGSLYLSHPDLHHIFSGWLGIIGFWFPLKLTFWRPDLMFISPDQGATASTDSTATDFSPTATPSPEPVRHLLFGSLSAVRSTICTLHKLGYADPNDWSAPISTGRANEVMAILTKRVGGG